MPLPQVTPVVAGLEDRHPYVRRTAVMGVLKIWHLSRDVVEAQGLLASVRTLLGREGDAQVIANCVTLLVQVRVRVLRMQQWRQLAMKMQLGSGGVCAVLVPLRSASLPPPSLLPHATYQLSQ